MSTKNKFLCVRNAIATLSDDELSHAIVSLKTSSSRAIILKVVPEDRREAALVRLQDPDKNATRALLGTIGSKLSPLGVETLLVALKRIEGCVCDTAEVTW